MMVNISIPTAAMITCDGDQFPVGIRLEALNLQHQPGTSLLNDNSNVKTRGLIQVDLVHKNGAIINNFF